MDEYSKKAAKISELAGMSPEQLTNHMISKSPGLSDVAPSIAPHVYSIATKGLSFLHQKLPKPTSEFVGDEDWTPTNAQKADWLDHYQAVHDPIGILEHVKNGELTNAHVDALNAVHPDLYKDMQHEIMSNVTAKSMKALPYSTKIALSKFLQQPQDESLVPQVILSDQANYASTPTISPSAPKHRSTLGGLSKLNLAERAATEMHIDESDDV